MQPDHSKMSELTQGLRSKSEKMRVLATAGFERAHIARFLGTRYQFVRNVLVQEEARSAKLESAQRAGAKETLRPTKVKLGPEGRIVIPAAFRAALGLAEGDTLVASLENGELSLLTLPAAVRKAQAIVRKFVPPGVSLVDELIEDRRKEIKSEKNG